MRPFLRRLGLGRLAYHLYHAPLGVVRDSVAAGGPLEQWRTRRGQSAMEQAARRLPVLAPVGGPPLELHLLTGRRFWYQTAFCLWTLARHANRPLAPVIYDDGSLTAEYQDPLSRLFPTVRFVLRAETVGRLDEHLPAGRFPALRERWLNYPNIRKLTDPHVGGKNWKLVLDSDLLFFRRPEFLLAWADAPAGPLHAVDCETSYGYDRAHMDRLAGAPVADLVNVGLTGLEGGGLDWEKLEHWTRELQQREGTSYYLEQALIAMLVAGRQCAVAPAADYVTLPLPPEARDCRAVMHHYVAGSKRWYFRDNWRRVLVAAAGTP
jgi:hypothetical protein